MEYIGYILKIEDGIAYCDIKNELGKKFEADFPANFFGTEEVEEQTSFSLNIKLLEAIKLSEEELRRIEEEMDATFPPNDSILY